LRKAAQSLNIKVLDAVPKYNGRMPPTFFQYGTRPFVLPNVNHPVNIFGGQEYIYDFSFLMAILPEELFNWGAVLAPLGLVNKDSSFKHGDWFLRPNSGNKQFAGRVFSSFELQQDITYLLHMNPWELLIAAEAKQAPEREYRFFCIKDKNDEVQMVGCEYLPTQQNIIPSNIKDYALEIASRIFEKLTVGNSFVLDIAEIDSQLSIIELNSWESSSFYSIDPINLLESITCL
jgi:hypothetical protein